MQEAGALGHVCENSIAIVVEQNVLAHTGDENVIEAIVIVVADRNADCPDAAAQTRLRGDVFERAVAVVVIEPDSGAGRGGAGLAATGEDYYVLPAVVVVVNEGSSAAHGSEDVIYMAFVAIDYGGGESG